MEKVPDPNIVGILVLDGNIDFIVLYLLGMNDEIGAVPCEYYFGRFGTSSWILDMGFWSDFGSFDGFTLRWMPSYG